MIPKQDVSSKVSQETDDLKKKGAVDALSEKPATLNREDRIDQEESPQQRDSTSCPHEVARRPSIPPPTSDKSNKLRSNELPDAIRTLIRTCDDGQSGNINHGENPLHEYYVPMAEEGPCFQSSQNSSEDKI